MTALDELEELPDGIQVIVASLLFDLGTRFDMDTDECDKALEVAIERYYKWRHNQTM